MKKFAIFSIVSMLILGNVFSFAEDKNTNGAKKPVLTVEEATKKAIQNNTNLLKFEVTRERVLKGIDDNYKTSDSVFKIRDNFIRDAQNSPDYENIVKTADEQLKKSIAISDVAISRLISQRENIDMGKLLEIENINLTVKRLFTSINQKQKDIEILSKKIALDEKNLVILEKKLARGKISKQKFNVQSLELSKNYNRIKIEKANLDNYYNELSNLINANSKEYSLEVFAPEYKVVELSEAMQDVQNNRAATYSINVLSKKNEKMINDAIYRNYPAVDVDTTYSEVNDNKAISEIEEKQSVKDAKKNSQAKYNNLQSLQQNIEISKKDFEKLKLQYKSVETRYKKGMVAKNTFESMKYDLSEAENGLNALLTEHYQLRMAYENPYFAGQ